MKDDQNRRSETLFDGITDIRDDLVDQAREPYGQHSDDPAGQAQLPYRRHRKKWQFAAAAAVVAVIAAGVIALQTGNKQTVAANVIAEAEYPKMAPYPDESEFIGADGTFDDDGFSKVYDAWWEEVQARREITGYEDGLDEFFTKSVRQFLSFAGQENRVYSPLNVYMALGMLAELTDGNSRRQILDLLGSKDIQSLRKQASDLWTANYCDDGAVTSILAASLWLDQDTSFIQSTMDTLAESYHASSYRGKMGSAAYDRLLQEWLNEQTGEFLKEQASAQKLNPETILALATTVYFRAKWNTVFADEMTKKETFHADTGDVDCDFMHKYQNAGAYYWGEKFSAVAQGLEGSGSMWFILPDEGVSVDELLQDEQAMEFLVSNDRGEWEDQKQMLINLSVPKFDVASSIQLQEGLEALGVTDVFDSESSDFSAMTANAEGLFLSQADHAARVAIDEEGVTAAAYTVMTVSGAGMPMGEEIDFVLDRPFLFVITGNDGLPLFTGVVRQP